MMEGEESLATAIKEIFRIQNKSIDQSILLYTNLSLLSQEGFAPPEDDDVDKGAEGEQEEF